MSNLELQYRPRSRRDKQQAAAAAIRDQRQRDRVSRAADAIARHFAAARAKVVPIAELPDVWDGRELRCQPKRE